MVTRLLPAAFLICIVRAGPAADTKTCSSFETAEAVLRTVFSISTTLRAGQRRSGDPPRKVTMHYKRSTSKSAWRG